MRSHGVLSHPSWVCGLKQNLVVVADAHPQSHPSWVCGLKQNKKLETEQDEIESHPSWVCGLKHGNIENCTEVTLSHPSWVCGLKRPAYQRAEGTASHTLRGCVD